VLLGFAVAAVKSSESGWVFLLLLAFAVTGTVLATSTLSSGAAIVSATSKVRGYEGRRAALLVISLALFTCGVIVGGGAARYVNAQAVWPSVALAALGLIVGVFAQHHRELNESVDELDLALADLYNELLEEDGDWRELRRAAPRVESAITTRSRGPLSLAPLPIINYDLQICVLHLLAIAAKLPIRGPSAAQAAFITKRLGGHDTRVLLGDWHGRYNEGCCDRQGQSADRTGIPSYP
jgi:MFS family permease